MKKILLLFLLIAGAGSICRAQLSFGFKAGLNYNKIQGETETDANGRELETTDSKTGFHVGGLMIYRITDAFGAQAELLFSQKGGRNNFNGPSFQVFQTESGNTLLTTGNKKVELTITNSYIDIPIMGYALIGNKLKIAGGLNVGFLVSSSGSGELTYSGQTRNGTPVEEFTITLDYNYFSDRPGDVNLNDPIILTIGNETVKVPRTAGAYFEFEDENGNFYKSIDVGLNGELAFFINRGLFLGIRINYGLTDISNDQFDVSRVNSNGLEFITRSDKDTNLSIQAGLGFSF